MRNQKDGRQPPVENPYLSCNPRKDLSIGGRTAALCVIEPAHKFLVGAAGGDQWAGLELSHVMCLGSEGVCQQQVGHR